MSKKYYERLAKTSGFSSKQFESDFGLKILKKFGWAEGKGLGKNEDGREECIQTKRRDIGQGLGVEKKAAAEAQWENWWSDCYNDVAKKIAEKKRSSPSPSPSPSPSASRASASPSPEAESSSDSDSDGDEPAGGRVTAIKGASRMAGKLKRVFRQEAPPARLPAASKATKSPEEKNASPKKRGREEELEKAEEEASPVAGKKARAAKKHLSPKGSDEENMQASEPSASASPSGKTDRKKKKEKGSPATKEEEGATNSQ